MTFICPRCRQRSVMAGSCPSCVRKRNYVQMRPEHEAGLTALSEVSSEDLPRLPIPCWPEVENMIDGGFVSGTVLALYGTPGIGKSTLALALADAMATLGPAGYLTSEQLVPQIKLTAVRVGISESSVLVGHVTTVEEVEQALRENKLRFLVVDSLQGCCMKGEEEVTAKRLVHAARSHQVAMLIVLHSTKDGDYSGPRAVEHEVDGMIEMGPALTDKGPDPVFGAVLTVVDKYRYGPIGRTARVGRSENGRLWDMSYGPF